jgi:hypothetical protein
MTLALTEPLSNPHVVPGIERRLGALTTLWQQRREPVELRLPARRDFDAVQFRPWLGNLQLLHVQADDFVHVVYGSCIAELFGQDWTGRRVGELPLEQRDALLPAYCEAQRTGRPAAVEAELPIFRTYVDFEPHLTRLHGIVLPLADDGSTVDRLLVAVYAVVLDD